MRTSSGIEHEAEGAGPQAGRVDAGRHRRRVSARRERRRSGSSARRGVRVLGLERFTAPNAMGFESRRDAHHPPRDRRGRGLHAVRPTRPYALWPRARGAERGAAVRSSRACSSWPRPTARRAPTRCPTSSGARATSRVRTGSRTRRSTARPSAPASRSSPAPPTPTRATSSRARATSSPDRCIAAQLERARAHGATVREHVEVRALHTDAQGVTVETSAGDFHAGRVVVAAGAWSGDPARRAVRHAADRSPAGVALVRARRARRGGRCGGRCGSRRLRGHARLRLAARSRATTTCSTASRRCRAAGTIKVADEQYVTATHVPRRSRASSSRPSPPACTPPTSPGGSPACRHAPPRASPAPTR